MNKLSLLALALAVAGGAHAQTVTHTETTVKSTTPVAPAPVTERVTETNTETRVDATGKTTVETTRYDERLRSAYSTAGVSAAEIDRLIAIDARARDAIAANDKARVKQYYEEQTRILQPAQVEKVRVYLKENPITVAPASTTVAVPAQPRVLTTYEYVPTMAGVKLDTPLGSVGIGVPTGNKVVETKTVVP